MIIGQYSSKVGEKNRVAFPKKFRQEMGDKLLVTRGYEGCLVVVDASQWKNITRNIVDGSFVDKKIRDTSRFLIAGAHEIDLDTQGRFVIPSGLVEYAQIQDEAIFLGLMNWVEIWSHSDWKKHEEYIRKNGDQIAQKLVEVNSENHNE